MVVLGRISRPCILLIQVLENSCDDLGLGDEGQDPKLAATGTEEWVGFVYRYRFQLDTVFFSQSARSRGIAEYSSTGLRRLNRVLFLKLSRGFRP
jgi:hypothetical protein